MKRTLTTADGRKLEGTILSKDVTSIQFRRTTDGKEFMLELSKLSAEDQAFIGTLHAPAPGDHLIGDWVCNDVPTDIYSIKDDKSAGHSHHRPRNSRNLASYGSTSNYPMEEWLPPYYRYYPDGSDGRCQELLTRWQPYRLF